MAKRHDAQQLGRASSYVSFVGRPKAGWGASYQLDRNRDMKSLFTWLHLSDIHIGHGDVSHQWDQRLVLRAMEDDTKSPHNPAFPFIKKIDAF